MQKELTKTKSTRAKGKEIPSKKNIADQKQEQGKKMKVHTVRQKRWKGSKNVVSPPARLGRRTQAKVESKSRKKDKNGGKAKKGQKVTFTDVERFFMKLMNGAN